VQLRHQKSAIATEEDSPCFPTADVYRNTDPEKFLEQKMSMRSQLDQLSTNGQIGDEKMHSNPTSFGGTDLVDHR